MCDTPCLCRSGLIPAHAGKTAPILPYVVNNRAHPRSRGENLWPNHYGGYWDGSSPLTRGKRVFAGELVGVPGLIPAHAGKTSTKVKTADIETAHPRSRGENMPSAYSSDLISGSSPLTRGKPALVGLGARRVGLIPAHAGKTGLWLLYISRCGAHPRSRGENKVEGLVGVADLGSSPLTRGKRPSVCPRPCQRGLIPAHAGKTKYDASNTM